MEPMFGEGDLVWARPEPSDPQCCAVVFNDVKTVAEWDLPLSDEISKEFIARSALPGSGAVVAWLLAQRTFKVLQPSDGRKVGVWKMEWLTYGLLKGEVSGDSLQMLRQVRKIFKTFGTREEQVAHYKKFCRESLEEPNSDDVSLGGISDSSSSGSHNDKSKPYWDSDSDSGSSDGGSVWGRNNSVDSEDDSNGAGSKGRKRGRSAEDESENATEVESERNITKDTAKDNTEVIKKEMEKGGEAIRRDSKKARHTGRFEEGLRKRALSEEDGDAGEHAEVAPDGPKDPHAPSHGHTAANAGPDTGAAALKTEAAAPDRLKRPKRETLGRPPEKFIPECSSAHNRRVHLEHAGPATAPVSSAHALRQAAAKKQKQKRLEEEALQAEKQRKLELAKAEEAKAEQQRRAREQRLAERKRTDASAALLAAAAPPALPEGAPADVRKPCRKGRSAVAGTANASARRSPRGLTADPATGLIAAAAPARADAPATNLEAVAAPAPAEPSATNVVAAAATAQAKPPAPTPSGEAESPGAVLRSQSPPPRSPRAAANAGPAMAVGRAKPAKATGVKKTGRKVSAARTVKKGPARNKKAVVPPAPQDDAQPAAPPANDAVGGVPSGSDSAAPAVVAALPPEDAAPAVATPQGAAGGGSAAQFVPSHPANGGDGGSHVNGGSPNKQRGSDLSQHLATCPNDAGPSSPTLHTAAEDKGSSADLTGSSAGPAKICPGTAGLTDATAAAATVTPPSSPASEGDAAAIIRAEPTAKAAAACKLANDTKVAAPASVDDEQRVVCKGGGGSVAPSADSAAPTGGCCANFKKGGLVEGLTAQNGGSSAQLDHSRSESVAATAAALEGTSHLGKIIPSIQNLKRAHGDGDAQQPQLERQSETSPKGGELCDRPTDNCACAKAPTMPTGDSTIASAGASALRATDHTNGVIQTERLKLADSPQDGAPLTKADTGVPSSSAPARVARGDGGASPSAHISMNGVAQAQPVKGPLPQGLPATPPHGSTLIPATANSAADTNAFPGAVQPDPPGAAAASDGASAAITQRDLGAQASAEASAATPAAIAPRDTGAQATVGADAGSGPSAISAGAFSNSGSEVAISATAVAVPLAASAGPAPTNVATGPAPVPMPASAPPLPAAAGPAPMEVAPAPMPAAAPATVSAASQLAAPVAVHAPAVAVAVPDIAHPAPPAPVGNPPAPVAVAAGGERKTRASKRLAAAMDMDPPGQQLAEVVHKDKRARRTGGEAAAPPTAGALPPSSMASSKLRRGTRSAVTNGGPVAPPQPPLAASPTASAPGAMDMDDLSAQAGPSAAHGASLAAATNGGASATAAAQRTHRSCAPLAPSPALSADAANAAMDTEIPPLKPLATTLRSASPMDVAYGGAPSAPSHTRTPSVNPLASGRLGECPGEVPIARARGACTEAHRVANAAGRSRADSKDHARTTSKAGSTGTAPPPAAGGGKAPTGPATAPTLRLRKEAVASPNIGEDVARRISDMTRRAGLEGGSAGSSNTGAPGAPAAPPAVVAKARPSAKREPRAPPRPGTRKSERLTCEEVAVEEAKAAPELEPEGAEIEVAQNPRSQPTAQRGTRPETKIGVEEQQPIKRAPKPNKTYINEHYVATGPKGRPRGNSGSSVHNGSEASFSGAEDVSTRNPSAATTKRPPKIARGSSKVRPEYRAGPSAEEVQKANAREVACALLKRRGASGKGKMADLHRDRAPSKLRTEIVDLFMDDDHDSMERLRALDLILPPNLLDSIENGAQMPVGPYTTQLMGSQPAWNSALFVHQTADTAAGGFTAGGPAPCRPMRAMATDAALRNYQYQLLQGSRKTAGPDGSIQVACMTYGQKDKVSEPRPVASHREAIREAARKAADEKAPDHLTQPFRLHVHPDVVSVVDAHAHLSNTAVKGILAGHYWDGCRYPGDVDPKPTLYIQTAFPLSERHDQSGIQPGCGDNGQEQAILRLLEMLGLQEVGRYMSHPDCGTEPSISEVSSHARTQENHGGPYVSLVVGTYGTPARADGSYDIPSTFRFFKTDGVELVGGEEHGTTGTMVEEGRKRRRTNSNADKAGGAEPERAVVTKPFDLAATLLRTIPQEGPRRLPHHTLDERGAALELLHLQGGSPMHVTEAQWAEHEDTQEGGLLLSVLRDQAEAGLDETAYQGLADLLVQPHTQAFTQAVGDIDKSAFLSSENAGRQQLHQGINTSAFLSSENAERQQIYQGFLHSLGQFIAPDSRVDFTAKWQGITRGEKIARSAYEHLRAGGFGEPRSFLEATLAHLGRQWAGQP